MFRLEIATDGGVHIGHVNIIVGAYLTWLGDQNLLEDIMADRIMKAVRK
ncbi:MAG: hypothetical protein KJ774_02910 [Firmicutes bacterium]|nr:hypothetical protein [Bacillota bacterium]